MSLPADIDHAHYLRLTLSEARKSPPKPTNFCVGALLLSPSTSASPLVTGYTLECAGNTHAEQCCFLKFAERCDIGRPVSSGGIELEERLGPHLPQDTILYTSMEPCNKRSVGNTPCTERILSLRRKDGTPAIRTVVVGVVEPETFVGVNGGRKRLTGAGIQVVHVDGMEAEILEVAKAGHVKQDEG